MLKIDNYFFKKYQSKLLFVANNIFLRWFLGLNRLPKEIRYQYIEKITPSSVHTIKGYDINNNPLYEAHCFTNPRFAEALAYNVTPFVYLMNLRSYKYEWRFSPVGFVTSLLLLIALPKSGMFAFMGTVTDYYAGAGDGYVNYNNATYSTCRSAGTGNGSGYTEASIDGSIVARSIFFSAQYYSSRGFFPIDTSGLGSGATITSATMSHYIEVSATYNADSDSLSVVQTSQASTSSLSNSDFGSVTFTDGGSKTLASFSVANQYWVWTLNGTALGWINKTGVSKLGVISLREINNNTPTGLNQLGGAWYFSDNTGTSKDPYLSVTYTTSTDVTVNPSVQTSTFSIPAYTVTAERFVTVTPTVLSATFTIPNPTESGGAGVSPAVNTATFSIPTYTVVADGSVAVSPAVKTATFNIPVYTTVATSNATVIPSLQACTFSIPTYTVTLITGVTVSVDTQTSTFSIPTYRIIADYWEDKFTQPANAWSDTFTQPANGWNDKY